MFLLGIILTSLLMPIAVFGITSDTVDAAVIAGFFSILNTYLNIKMLRQIGVTKKVARESSNALLEIANVRKQDKSKQEDN